MLCVNKGKLKDLSQNFWEVWVLVKKAIIEVWKGKKSGLYKHQRRKEVCPENYPHLLLCRPFLHLSFNLHFHTENWPLLRSWPPRLTWIWVSDLLFMVLFKSFHFLCLNFFIKKNSDTIVLSKAIVRIKWACLWESRAASAHEESLLLAVLLRMLTHLIHSDQFSVGPFNASSRPHHWHHSSALTLTSSAFWLVIDWVNSLAWTISTPSFPRTTHAQWDTLLLFFSLSPAWVNLSFVHCRSYASSPCQIECLCFLNPACSYKCFHLFWISACSAYRELFHSEKVWLIIQLSR